MGKLIIQALLDAMPLYYSDIFIAAMKANKNTIADGTWWENLSIGMAF